MTFNKLTKEEIARVFHLYSEADVQWREHTYPGFHVFKGLLEGLIEECKLKLTPLSTITDEHAIEMYHLYCGEIAKYDYTQDFKGIGRAARIWADNAGREEINKYACLIDYARQHGYDTKIYFKANHKANGKTPIELGIAIDRTTLPTI